MKCVLVPLDGSEFAEQALQPALALAGRSGAELHLASIVSDLPPIPLASGDGEIVSRWFDDEKKRAEEYLASVRDRLAADGSSVPLALHVRVGPVTQALEAIGKKIDADLVVLTTHGRGAWQRAWLGSVADQLLRNGAFPILLLREGKGSAPIPFSDPDYPQRILVPLDGSEAAEAVLPLLSSVAPEAGSTVILASVVHPPFPLASVYLPHAVSEEGFTEEREKETLAYLKEAEARLPSAGSKEVRSRVVLGEDAAKSLLSVAEEEGVEMIALSTRGRGGVSRLLLGSVADKIVRGATQALLIARRTHD